MRLVDSIFGLLIFGTSHVAGWAISPRPIVVEENTKASDLLDGGIIISIASDSSGVTDYLLSGTPEDTAPFELKTSNTCGAAIKSCADLKLRDSWEDDNGNIVNILDRETKSMYTMTLKAVTKDNQIQEESTVVVTVRDSNDNQPVFTPASKEIRCKENSVHGSKCGSVTATDADSSHKGNNQVEYSIPTTNEIWTSRDGNEENRNLGMFRVDAETGEITLNNPGNNWDAEKYEKVEITVRAQDAPGQMARTGPVDEQITIFIEDENDNRATANEYPRNGLKVGELSALFTQMTLPGKDYTFAGSDDDVEADNNRVTFEVISPNDSPFSITSIGNSNNAYLVVNKTLDFETTPKYELTIRAANRHAKSNVDRMSETFTVQVDIEDENEPPIWSNNKVVFNENVRAGAGPSNGIHPHAEDPDFGGISAITYTKVADPENYFSIDKKTGQITFSPRNSDDVLDRECEHCNWKEGYYNLTLEACDEESLCSKFHQRIDIVDVDDSVPIVNAPKDGFNVCTKPKNGIVWKELEISDRDDCRVNHCQTTAQVEIEGQYRRTFDLVKQNNIMYELRLRDPNEELETKTYEIQVRATADGRSQTSLIRLRVCSCADGAEKPSEGCQMTITAGPGLAMSSLMAIIAAILLLILLIVSLVIYKQRKDRNSPKAGLLDDIDDETGNIMVYSNEGGGEEDQTNYNTATLIKAKNEVPTSRIQKPIRPHPGFGSGIDPKDIGQYIDDAKNHADQDVHAAPYDSLLTFDYEGNNSIIDDLSSTDSELDLGDFDPDNNIATWGPKFRKLADLYAGRENDAYDHS